MQPLLGIILAPTPLQFQRGKVRIQGTAHRACLGQADARALHSKAVPHQHEQRWACRRHYLCLEERMHYCAYSSAHYTGPVPKRNRHSSEPAFRMLVIYLKGYYSD